jgi:hypothetical protein
MIVKIQRPLMSTDPNAPVLIYNQDRTFETMVPFDRMMQFIMGDRVKMYAEVEILPDNSLGILRDLKESEW